MKKTFEDLDAYERWARRSARIQALAWIALSASIIAIDAPSAGYDTKDLMVLLAALAIGLLLAKIFEAALMPGVADWGRKAWRQRLSFLVGMVLADVVLWLVSGRSGSGLTIWPIFWAGLIGSYLLVLARAKEYGRWKREQYDADLREIAGAGL